MTWSGDTGSKSRKNNFLSVGGSVKNLTVEGVRVHNNHDPFYLSTVNQSILRDLWISWNCDDLYESSLHTKIIDTLVDGTYTFLSAPDRCNGGNLAANTTTIENSLIRLEPMPARYGKKPGTKYHWVVSGGFNAIWKPDPECGGMGGDPKFELRNNVFLVEGSLGGNNGLPFGSNIGKITTCENNLFLYTGGSITDAPRPTPGSKYYNSANSNYQPNGTDCFQAIINKTEALRIWKEKREQWIARHTGNSDPKQNVMMIPGIDYPAFSANQTLQIRNKSTGLCIQKNASGADATLASCNGSEAQLWSLQPFADGKLRGAILLRNKAGGYLRSQDQEALAGDTDDSDYDPDVFWSNVSSPNFIERWYVYPLAKEPGGEAGTYAIEFDALRRSFIFANGSKVQAQLFWDRAN